MSLGELSVTIGAQTDSFKKGIRGALGDTDQLRKRFNTGVKSAAKYGAAMTAAGIAITAALTKRGLQAVDEQAKLARQLGGTTAAVQGLTRVASMAGVSQGQLATSTVSLNRRLGEAAQGSGAAAKSLERLGLTAQQLSSVDVDERMALIADAMRDGGLSSQQMAFELRELGIRQGAVVNLMQEGGDAIRGSRRAVEQFGIAVSDVEASQIEAANDAFADISNIVQGVSNQLAVNLAPILEGVANRINQMAIETNGFRDGISRAVNFSVRGFGFLADSIEGVRRVFEVTGKAIAVAMHGGIGVVMNLSASIVEGPIRDMNALIEIMNRIPGINIPLGQIPDFAKNFRQMSDDSYAAVKAGMDDIVETIDRPMPSQKINQFIEEVTEASRTSAEKTVQDRENSNLAMLELQQEHNEEELEMIREQQEKERELREERLEAIRESLMDEREAELQSHERKMQDLENAHQSQLMSEQEIKELKEKLEAQHQDNLTRIERKGLSDREKFERLSMHNRVSTVMGELERMTAGVANENKTLFNLNKAAGIGNAIISSYEGYTKALATYPPPISYGMAATSLATGFAAVKKIKSQSMGGGSSMSPPSRPNAQPTNNMPGIGQAGGGGGAMGGGDINRTLTVRTIGPGAEWVRDQLIPEINEAIGDGVNIRST